MVSRFPLHLFAGSTAHTLATQVASALGIALGTVTHHCFHDGELCPIISGPLRHSHVVLVQALPPPAHHWLELLLMANAAKAAGAHAVTALIPYLGYARQTQPHVPGAPASAPLMAQLLATAGIDHCLLADLHSPQLLTHFPMPTWHLSHADFFMPYLQQQSWKPQVIAAPDTGARLRAQPHAQEGNMPLVQLHKKRQAPNTIAHLALQGNVQGAHVLLVDDIIDTGQTLSQAANLLLQHGARSVRACCTHALLSGQAATLLEQSALTDIMVTDTLPRALTHACLTVVPTASRWAAALQQLHAHLAAATAPVHA